MPLIDPRLVCVIPGDAKRRQQGCGVSRTPHPCEYLQHTRALSLCDDRAHATAIAQSFWLRQNSTCHPARRRAGAGRGRRGDEGVPVRGWRGAARRLFFYGDHGRGTDPQHTGGIADAAAADSHVDHLAADLRHPASILVLEEKDPSRALPILTLPG